MISSLTNLIDYLINKAFIRVLFDMFYDEDIISEGVFWKWNQEAREEGHAFSALSLKGFFDWLSESDLN